ncbi:MAG TPA: hypothetical protein VLJ60_00735 [bacterium]|nr:hypothetical protein [bacterium]
MSRKKLMIVISGIVAVVAVCLAVYWFFFMHGAPLKWEIDKRYSFSFNYKSKSFNHFVNPQGSDRKVSGNFKCDMAFSIYPLKKMDDGNVLAEFSFDRIGECFFLFNGDNLFANPAAISTIFTGRKAAIVLTPDGNITDTRFSKNEDQVFMSTVKLVASYVRTNASSVEVPVEHDQNGSYKAVYSKTKKDSATLITKKFDKYLTLLAFPSGITENRQDHNVNIIHTVEKRLLKNAKGSQKTAMYNQDKTLIFSLEMDFTLELTKVSDENNSIRLIGLSNMRSSGIGTVEISKETERKLQEQQTRNLTSTEMTDTLANFGFNGKIDDKKQFIWRAAAYLRLYPERTEDLIPLFNAEGFSSEGKILLMGLLTSSGHEKAQEVMRTLLSADAAKNDKLYPLLLQNISMLDNPDRQTMSFVENLYAQSKLSGKLESTTSLMVGSVAGKMMQQGDTLNGMRLNNTLLKDLDNAKTPDKAEKLLDALGNASIADNIKTAIEYSGSVNPRIRATVANVVRNVQTPESERLLLDLLDDKENIVKMQAVNTLGMYALKEEHLEHIKEKLRDDTLGPDQYYYVLGVLKKYEKSNSGIVEKSLVEMSRRPMHADLHSQVTNMLKNMREKK